MHKNLLKSLSLLQLRLKDKIDRPKDSLSSLFGVSEQNCEALASKRVNTRGPRRDPRNTDGPPEFGRDGYMPSYWSRGRLDRKKTDKRTGKVGILNWTNSPSMYINHAAVNNLKAFRVGLVPRSFE